MPLDLDKVKVVPVTECTGEYILLSPDTYRSNDLFSFVHHQQHLLDWIETKLFSTLKQKYNQTTGILPILRWRIACHCMTNEWLYNDMIMSPNYRPECKDDNKELDILFWERRLILPNEIETKLLPYADLDMESLYADDYDFLFIEW